MLFHRVKKKKQYKVSDREALVLVARLREADQRQHIERPAGFYEDVHRQYSKAYK